MQLLVQILAGYESPNTVYITVNHMETRQCVIHSACCCGFFFLFFFFFLCCRWCHLSGRSFNVVQDMCSRYAKNVVTRCYVPYTFLALTQLEEVCKHKHGYTMWRSVYQRWPCSVTVRVGATWVQASRGTGKGTIVLGVCPLVIGSHWTIDTKCEQPQSNITGDNW